VEIRWFSRSLKLWVAAALQATGEGSKAEVAGMEELNAVRYPSRLRE
jgi:hypothetical protein